MRKPTLAVIGGVVALAALCGCTSTTSSLSQSASSASSAVNTAQLAMTQQKADRTFLTTTRTALSDALTELTDAETSAAELQPGTAGETALQKRTLTAIRSATDAVLAAQRTVAADAASALPGLHSASRTLERLSGELEKREQK
jgi:hypothetical protein